MASGCVSLASRRKQRTAPEPNRSPGAAAASISAIASAAVIGTVLAGRGVISADRIFTPRPEQGRMQQPRVTAPVEPRSRPAARPAGLRGLAGALHEPGHRQDLPVEVAGV